MAKDSPENDNPVIIIRDQLGGVNVDVGDGRTEIIIITIMITIIVNVLTIIIIE